MNILIFSRNSHYNESPAGGAEASLRLNTEKFSSIGENVIYVTQARSKTPSIGHNKSIFPKDGIILILIHLKLFFSFQEFESDLQSI